MKILMGDSEEVKAVVQRSEYMDAADPAFLHAMLNQPDESIQWLEKAYQERSVMLVTLKNFWVWYNLRKDARFKAIYNRMNFPPSASKRSKLQPVKLQPINNALLNPQEMEHYLKKLTYLVEEQALYTDPALSLRWLVEKMELYPNKLSWLINEQMGKNFNEYVKAFRLQTFKQKALDSANSHYTILGLAYESGFNSKRFLMRSSKKWKV